MKNTNFISPPKNWIRSIPKPNGLVLGFRNWELDRLRTDHPYFELAKCNVSYVDRFGLDLGWVGYVPSKLFRK